MTENNGAGLYTQPIVETLRRVGLLSGRELKTRCDSDFQISQSDSSFYRCLKGLKYLGFVQNTGDKYELTFFGNDLATRSGDAFFNYYLFGYMRCPECRRNGNLVKCEIENISKFSRSVSVFVRCPFVGIQTPHFFVIYLMKNLWRYTMRFDFTLDVKNDRRRSIRSTNRSGY
jgi:hypothetical protein